MESKRFVINNENVKDYVGSIAKWIKCQVQNAGANGVVLGMSGGVDCSVVARLCQVAGVDVQLVLMPYGENMKSSRSYEDAMELIDRYNFEYHVFDIQKAVDDLKISPKGIESRRLELAEENLKPRVRMTYLYEYARNK